MLEQYVKRILSARVYDVAEETPLRLATGLSNRLHNQIRLKREDLQPVYSFKLRGAYNMMSSLNEAQRARGVIAASAGNHAQGVALAARHLHIKALIVMGRNAPSIKIDAVRDLGGKVVLHGDTYDEAAVHALELANQKGYVFVPPFDDVNIIAGQGTVGMEIVNQHPGDPDVIYVPVGGGGLIAGIAAYVKYLKPDTLIVGVEAEGSACLHAALRAGRRVKLPSETLDLFADGVSVAQIGKETFKIARRYVDEVVVASTDEICAAIKDIFGETRVLAEPAGALAVAGMKKHIAAHKLQGQKLVAVVSGANVNFDRLRHIAERAEVGEQRELVIAATIPERKGSFRRFCRDIGKRAVTEFNYRFVSKEAAHVYVGLGIVPGESRNQVLQSIERAGYSVVDMTDNETAKLHVRHMVGGHGVNAATELLFRFEFPERPGALMNFLAGLGSRWNITLFHYRNHGAAWGRILVGFEADVSDQKTLEAFLRRIGYRFWPETGNPAYEIFLR